ncbi:MAG: DUF4785 family protein [Rhodanobacteraceae bacterium]|nr:MAG: DUF4785 family protein [Rhodanobacteraceae bacterium]
MRIQFPNLVTLAVAACLLPAAGLAATGPARYATGPVPVITAVPGQLATAERVHLALDHAPVAVSWAVPATQRIDSSPRPYRQVSRQYLINATGAELQRGVDVPLTAVGDIVRISPLGATSAAVDAAHLQIESRGRKVDATQVSQVVASGRQLAKAGMPIQGGSTVLKLGASVQPGRVRISAAGARGRYLVQVYEPQSPFALGLVAERGNNVAGQPVQVSVTFVPPAAGHATFAPSAARANLEQVTGVLQAPDGWSETVNFAPGAHGSYVASVMPPAAHAGERGLWEIHAFARGQAGGQTVLREADNAFAIVLPTARFSRAPVRAVTHAGQGVSVDVGVEVGAASRYAVSGVLYGHTANGQLRPAVYAQAADWLEPGRSVPIRLTFSATALARSGLKGPFELRDLTLEDQMQLGVLQRQALAARGLGPGR